MACECQLCKNIHSWVLHPLIHADPTIVAKSDLYLELEKKIRPTLVSVSLTERKRPMTNSGLK
jgi:hypothetical protein